MTQSNEGSRRKLPPDFPTEPVLGAVGGAQDKLLLCRRDDGRYGSQRRTPEEILHRFEVASDLVTQLVAYFNRKKLEFPEWSNEKNLERIRMALIQKAEQGKWAFSDAEQGWIMNRLRERCLDVFELAVDAENLRQDAIVQSAHGEKYPGKTTPRKAGGNVMPSTVDKILLLTAKAGYPEKL